MLQYKCIINIWIKNTALTCRFPLVFVLWAVSFSSLGFLVLLEYAVVFVYPRQEGPYMKICNTRILQTEHSAQADPLTFAHESLRSLASQLFSAMRVSCCAEFTVSQVFLACAPLWNKNEVSQGIYLQHY